MPFYDYKCNDCDKKFEVQKSMNDTSIPNCPNCSGSHTARIFSVPGISGSQKGGCSSCSDGVCTSCSCKS